MKQKQCLKCGEDKPVEEFYRHPQMSGGRVNTCKACVKAGRNLEKTAEANKRWRSRNSEKQHCHNALKLAISDGVVLKPSSCQSCGITDVQIHGHHPDYSQPLAVIWLCAPCHSRQHRLEREELRQQEPRGERAA